MNVWRAKWQNKPQQDCGFYHISTVLIIIYHPPLLSCKHFTTLVFISSRFFIPSILIKQCKLIALCGIIIEFFVPALCQSGHCLWKDMCLFTLTLPALWRKWNPGDFCYFGWLVPVAVVSVQLCEWQLFNSPVSSAASGGG